MGLYRKEVQLNEVVNSVIIYSFKKEKRLSFKGGYIVGKWLGSMGDLVEDKAIVVDFVYANLPQCWLSVFHSESHSPLPGMRWGTFFKGKFMPCF